MRCGKVDVPSEVIALQFVSNSLRIIEIETINRKLAYRAGVMRWGEIKQQPVTIE
jgi:hypothetical protein